MSNKVLCAIVTSIGLAISGGDRACAMMPFGQQLMEMVNNNRVHATTVGAFLSNKAISLKELNEALRHAEALRRPRVARAISSVSGPLALAALFGMVANPRTHAGTVAAFTRYYAISLRPFPTHAFRRNAFIVNPLQLALRRARELNRPMIAGVLRQHGAQ